MRIVSLVPAATEALFAMGLGGDVVAVSHACDHPEAARALPRASRSRIDTTGPSAAIDAAVREALQTGEPTVEVLEPVLHHVQPELVVAQGACEVCGITPSSVGAALARIEPGDWPEVLTLHPHTVDDVMADLVRLASAAGAPEAGRRLVAALRARMARIADALEGVEERPSVVVLDWLDPPMVAGHWVPELVARAGGEPPLAMLGEPSRWVAWEDVVAADPDVLVLAPCGFDVATTRRELSVLSDRAGWSGLRSVRDGRVFTLDANATLSRPGPRLVDGLELLALALHPNRLERGLGHRASEVPQLAPVST